MPPRILDAAPRELLVMNGAALKASIAAAEGRTIAAEVIAPYQSPVDGVSHGELAAAMSADLIILDQYDTLRPQISGVPADLLSQQSPLSAYAELIGRPIGLNLIVADAQQGAFLGGRLVNPANVERAVTQGCRIINLYTRPKIGGTHEGMLAAARMIHEVAGDDALLIGVPSFSRPAPRSTEAIRAYCEDALALIDFGCAGIALPMPGSKQGWTMDAAAAIVDVVRGAGALAWLFLTGSIEGAPESLITAMALQAKQIGADAYRIDEAGLSGMPVPENIFSFSLAIRGRQHTFRRMASARLR